MSCEEHTVRNSGLGGRAAKFVSLEAERCRLQRWGHRRAVALHEVFAKANPHAFLGLWNGTNRETLNARGDAAYCPPAVLVAVVRAWVDVGREQVQVVGADGRARRRRPEVAVRATIEHRTAVDVAGIDKIVRITSKCCSSSFTS